MKKLAVTVLMLGLMMQVNANIFFAAPPAGDLSIDGITVVHNGIIVNGAGTGWTFNNGILTLDGYQGAFIAAAHMGDLTLALAPGSVNRIAGSPLEAGITVGANTTLIIQGAVGSLLEIANPGAMDAGIVGDANTACIIFNMAYVLTTGVRYGIYSQGPIELQNGSEVISDSAHVGVFLSDAPLTVNHSLLDSAGQNGGIVISNQGLIVENAGMIVAQSDHGEGIEVSGGIIVMDTSTVNATGSRAGIASKGGSISINECEITAEGVDGHGIIADGDIYVSGSVVEATGRHRGSGIFSNGDIEIAGGQVNAGSSGEHSIVAEGGTIRFKSGTTAAPKGLRAGAIMITGGSLNTPPSLVTPQPVNGQGQPAWKTDMTLPGVPAGTQITDVAGVPADYDLTDLFTDEAGAIYLWLPVENRLTGAAVEGQQFQGDISGGSRGALIPIVTAPVITNINVTLTVSKDFSDSIIVAATGSPSPTFSATLLNGDPLPFWISINFTTGEITAAPTAAVVPGKYVIRVTAGNSEGAATKNFTVQVNAVPPTGDSGTVFLTGAMALGSLSVLCVIAIRRKPGIFPRRRREDDPF